MKVLWKNLLTIWKKCNLLIFFILILSCQSSDETITRQIDERLPDEQADSVTIISITKNFTDYELYAVHVDKYYDTKQIFADTVFVKTFNPDSSVKSTLYCNKAEVNEAKNILIGIGNVVVESDNGIMKTPYLIWDRNTDEVFAKNGVIFIREGNILYGEEMKTDINLDKIEITKVSAEGKINEEDIDW